MRRFSIEQTSGETMGEREVKEGAIFFGGMGYMSRDLAGPSHYRVVERGSGRLRCKIRDLECGS